MGADHHESALWQVCIVESSLSGAGECRRFQRSAAYATGTGRLFKGGDFHCVTPTARPTIMLRNRWQSLRRIPMKKAEERTAQAEWIIQPLALPRWWVAPLYLSGYVLLDHISFVFPLVPFGITPWNPPTGLSFVLILLAGRRYLPLLFLAPFTADFLLRGMQVPLWVE